MLYYIATGTSRRLDTGIDLSTLFLACALIAVTTAPAGAATITVTVENFGDSTGTEDVELIIDGLVVDTESVTLSPGESTTVTFAVPEDTVGSHDIEVGDLADSYNVAAPPSGPPLLLYGFLLVLVAVTVYLFTMKAE